MGIMGCFFGFVDAVTHMRIFARLDGMGSKDPQTMRGTFDKGDVLVKVRAAA